jgi:leader peptidase (prepilin peptidase)/N-methyltransferase
LQTALLTIAGLLLGPWLHTLAIQAGADLPFRLNAAHCRVCDQPVSTFDLRCSSCGRTRWREWLTGLVAAAGFAAMSWRFGTDPVLPAYVWLVGTGVVLILTDFDHFRIPNRILYPATVVSVVLLATSALPTGRAPDLLRGMLAGLAYGLFYFLVFLLARGRGLGFGDVKLAVMLGLYAGFQSWPTLVLALFATAIIGGAAAIILLGLGRGRKAELPYGPPLIMGTWLAIVLGPTFLSWYLG